MKLNRKKLIVIFIGVMLLVAVGFVVYEMLKDKTPPQLAGIQDEIVILNHDFDVMENITANDDRDGDCTEQIKAIGGGAIDTSKVGTYNLIYSVSDKAGNTSEAKRQVKVIKDEKRITGVPLILQKPLNYPNACETVSSTMLLQYYGYKVTPKEMASYVPQIALETKDGRLYGADPNEAFTGDVLGVGYGIYATPMQKAVQTYIDSKDSKYTVKSITGSTIEELKEYLRDGYLLQVWGTVAMNDVKTSNIKTWYKKTMDGEYTDQKITFPRSEHSLVVTGYDKDNIYLNDPLGIFKSVSIKTFEKAYQSMGSQAFILEERYAE